MSLYGYVCWVLFVHQFCVCFHLSVSYVIHSSFFSPQQRPSIFATGDGNYTNLHRHNSLDTVFRTPMGGKPSFLTPLEEAVMGCFLTGSPAMSPRFGSPTHLVPPLLFVHTAHPNRLTMKTIKSLCNILYRQSADNSFCFLKTSIQILIRWK